MNSLDEAPISSRHVLYTLIRSTEIPENVLSPLSIVTRIDPENRAETTVERPRNIREDIQQQWEDSIHRALLTLPGAYRAVKWVASTFSRSFVVTWDGIRRPI